MNDAALVEIRDLVKEYRALRPLRIQSLTVRPSEIVSIAGLDLAAAEMLITLVTGASLPEQGTVELFGRGTADIGDSDAWLRALDGVGMLSGRVVLLEPYSVRQNIALSLTLAIDPVPPDVLAVVDRLAAEAGLTESDLDQPIAGLAGDRQMRVRLARALAQDPRLLLAEHPSASLPRDGVEAFAADLARVAAGRGLGVLAITADAVFARSLGGTRLTLDPATGAVKPQGLWDRLAATLRPDRS